MYTRKLKKNMFLLGLIITIMTWILLSGCSLKNEKPITITTIENVTLNIGKEKKVTVTTVPQDTSIKAVSSNSNISTVTVKEKVLTIRGIAEGRAEIAITASKPGYKTATLKFEVDVINNLSISNIAIIDEIKVAYNTPFDELELPSVVDVTLNDGSKKSLAITWSKGNYDGDSPGTYELEGVLTLIDGITNNGNLKAKINIIVEELVLRNVEKIEIFQNMKVALGTIFSDLDLPQKVEVTLDDSSKVLMGLDWLVGSYDGNCAGTYNLEGSLILANGITNTGDLKTEIQINVNQLPIVTNFTPMVSTVHQNETMELNVLAVDPDGDQLTYRWEVNGELVVGEDNTNLTWNFLQAMLTKVTVLISDGYNQIEQSKTFQVNATPEITSFTASQYFMEIGEVVTIAVTAVDKENDNLTYRWELNESVMDGKTNSSITWSATELGTYYFDVFVSDHDQIEANSRIEINVVENCSPVIDDILGPKKVVITQKGVKILANYTHVDPNKELTLSWEASGGIIANGQNTGEINWEAPPEEGLYTLTFSVNDGDNTVMESMNILVVKPTINIFFNYDNDFTATKGEECSIRLVVRDIYNDADIQSSASDIDGDLLHVWTGNYENDYFTDYGWITPARAGVETITFETTINGVVFTETIDVTILENNSPIIDSISVNNHPVNLDEFIVLDVNELYHFEINVTDPEGDPLDIQWCFTSTNDFQGVNFFEPTVEYIANERSLTVAAIQVTDSFNNVATTKVCLIFEDGSVNDPTDPSIVQSIETIIDYFPIMFEQKDLEIIKHYLHPANEKQLEDILGEFVFESQWAGLYFIDRDFITFDAVEGTYNTFVFFNIETMPGVFETWLFSFSFQEDDNGLIKLFNFF